MSKLSHFPPQTDIVSKLRSCCCMWLNVFAWFPAFCKDDDTSKHLFKPLLSLQWHENTDSMSSRRIKTERFRGSHVQTVRLCAPEIQPCHEPLFVRVEKVSVWCIRGLAEEVRLQADTLKDVLGHAQHRIHCFDLFVSKQGEACNPEQGMERIHLQRRINKNQ